MLETSKKKIIINLELKVAKIKINWLTADFTHTMNLSRPENTKLLHTIP